MTPAEAIDRLYDLRPGTTPLAEGSPHERPHKPLLILAALDKQVASLKTQLTALRSMLEKEIDRT